MIKILILGASSDIGISLLKLLKERKDLKIGAHCFKGRGKLIQFSNKNNKNFKIFPKDLSNKKNCLSLVSKYLRWSKGIDILIQLNGDITSRKNWELMNENDWKQDLNINLSAPFFVSQAIFKKMKKRGGKIVFTSTSSANKGAGENSLAYGIAKAGIMALTKSLSKIGGKFDIKVNCVAPGFILTKLHTQRLKKSKKQIISRKKLNVLNKAGKPLDVANLIRYLVLDETNFITGEIIRVDGGDWI
jgi:3-oxoacyl-[acyl-carrier protein] reductase